MVVLVKQSGRGLHWRLDWAEARLPVLRQHRGRLKSPRADDILTSEDALPAAEKLWPVLHLRALSNAAMTVWSVRAHCARTNTGHRHGKLVLLVAKGRWAGHSHVLSQTNEAVTYFNANICFYTCNVSSHTSTFSLPTRQIKAQLLLSVRYSNLLWLLTVGSV